MGGGGLFDQGLQSTSPTMAPNMTLLSPEEQARIEKLRELEEKRMQALQEKIQNEIKIKNDKILKAKSDLQDWMNDQKKGMESRRLLNREEHEAKQKAKETNTLYKNSWDKIASNITLKEGDYPGSKDVGRMRQSILSKKADISK